MPWTVIAVWALVLLAAVPFAGKLGDVKRDTAVDYLPASADSTQVAKLQAALPGGDTTDLVLVYRRDGGLTAADREAAAAQVARVVDRHTTTQGRAPRAIPSRDGSTVMYPVALTALTDEKERADAVKDVRAELADHPKGLSVQ
ncbi:MMPL family transporter, partial [Streptomyces sp. MCAF7]